MRTITSPIKYEFLNIDTIWEDMPRHLILLVQYGREIVGATRISHRVINKNDLGAPTQKSLVCISGFSFSHFSF